MKTVLVFTPPGVPINSRVYVDQILDSYLIPFWHTACKEYGWTWIAEDNAPKHKRQANICRQINEVDTIPLPSQLSDFNLIEALWGEIETDIGEAVGRVEDIEVLKVMLRNAWNNIGIDRLDTLIRNMPRRLEAVIAAGGRATPY
ncbi:uncharacterized protein H6S33_004805 [Morchella sextelata]|uniref:uncharacterized protein n=1 Tax=Morchella sextelata TaxID=1174677 RepID=UPI001D0579E9|nr:uncharacterized protein H6S33_004805 [Morchella sextelata]KAH0605583.1 hypothetical protein H6S33_004805 [Morchella sextelata]